MLRVLLAVEDFWARVLPFGEEKREARPKLSCGAAVAIAFVLRETENDDDADGSPAAAPV